MMACVVIYPEDKITSFGLKNLVVNVSEGAVKFLASTSKMWKPGPVGPCPTPFSFTWHCVPACAKCMCVFNHLEPCTSSFQCSRKGTLCCCTARRCLKYEKPSLRSHLNMLIWYVVCRYRQEVKKVPVPPHATSLVGRVSVKASTVIKGQITCKKFLSLILSLKEIPAVQPLEHLRVEYIPARHTFSVGV